MVAILSLNYGLVAISYLTSEWPKVKKVEADKLQSAKANGDVVLGYIGKKGKKKGRERGRGRKRRMKRRRGEKRGKEW